MSELYKLTKGNIALTGKIVGLNNKKIRETQWSKEIGFGIMTTKNNMVYVKVNGFIKTDEDDILIEYYDENKKRQIEKVPYGDRYFLEEGQSIIGTKIKKTPDGQVETFVDVDAVEEIKQNFKDGDVVTIVANAVGDAYFQGLQFIVNKIYASTKVLDFEKGNFEEENHGRLWVAFADIHNNKVKAFVFDRKEEAIPLEFELDTEYITAEDFKEFEQGNILQIEYEYGKIPIYGEVEVKEDNKPKFKPKGKYASETTGSGRIYPQITGYTERLICTGISNINTEDKIDLKPYLSNEELEKNPF